MEKHSTFSSLVLGLLVLLGGNAIRAEVRDALPAGQGGEGSPQLSQSCQDVIMETIRKGYIARGNGTGSPKEILKTKCGFCHDSSQNQGMKEKIPPFSWDIAGGRKKFNMAKEMPFQSPYSNDVKGQVALLTTIKGRIEHGDMPPWMFKTGHAVETTLFRSRILVLSAAISQNEGAFLLPGSALAQQLAQQQIDQANELTAEIKRVQESVIITDTEKKTLYGWIDEAKSTMKNPACRDQTTVAAAAAPAAAPGGKIPEAKPGVVKPGAATAGKPAVKPAAKPADTPAAQSPERAPAVVAPAPVTGAALGDAVKKMLARSCFDCHGPKTHEENGRVDFGDITKLSDKITNEMAVRMRGGPNGNAAGGLAAMPYGDDRADPADLAILEAWIKNGKPRPSN